MFNPEKMLGNLLMGGVRRKRGLGGLLSGGAALGLVGVAMEAAEHFMKTQGQTAGSPPAPPGQTPSSRPPSPAPPPPPGPAANIPPAPPPATHAPAAQAPAAQAPAAQATAAQATAAQATASSSDQAVVLIRAMIAAANADG
nr:hypothetical protein [Desulfosarcinaceae bacterium]